MRLIDADALRREMPVDKYGTINTTITKFNIACEHSKVDAVPVIRCKECKWYEARIKRCNNSKSTEWKPDDYCSDAERRTDETD